MDLFNRKLLQFLVLFSLTVVLVHSEQPLYNCITSYGKITVCPGNLRPQKFSPYLAAFAKFANRINETGWAELEVVTNGDLEDEVQAYYAGYLEGYVTARLIRSHRHNVQDGNECANFGPAVLTNLKSTVKRVKMHRYDTYWREVGNSLYQVAGMDDGFALADGKNAPNQPHLEIDPCGTMMLNLNTELGDLANIINQTANVTPADHCSALIKIIDGGRDVLVAHNTWSNYNMMLRIAKKYTLNYSRTRSSSISFSSYPGIIFSVDDFYITSSRLVVQETTNVNHNMQLYRDAPLDQLIFEFIRNTVANRLGTSGPEWANIFAKYPSGTYNNQFMIVDFKRLAGNKLQDDFLWIIEQLPGIQVAKDQTEHLRQHSYWASYNIPFYPEIYNLSKNNEMFEKYGDPFSYQNTGRARIFHRDHVKVANVSTLYHLMRYNDFTHDPLSRCNCSPPYTAAYAIALRGDLNDPKGVYPIPQFAYRAHGALDAKMTNLKMVQNLEMVAISGPTNENVPTFSWATTKLQVQHLDHPTEWNFKPIITQWNNSMGVFPNFNFDF